MNVAFRIQHSATNQLFTVFSEGIPQTLLLWTQKWVDAILWTTVEFGVGWDLGRRAGGLVSGSGSLTSKINSEFLGAPLPDSTDTHAF